MADINSLIISRSCNLHRHTNIIIIRVYELFKYSYGLSTDASIIPRERVYIYKKIWPEKFKRSVEHSNLISTSASSLTKTFDTVHRLTCWRSILLKLWCPDKYTGLIRSLYDNVKTWIVSMMNY